MKFKYSEDDVCKTRNELDIGLKEARRLLEKQELLKALRKIENTEDIKDILRWILTEKV